MNEQAVAAEQVLAQWDARIHVLTNPNIWFSMLMAVGIPSVLLGVLVAFVAEDMSLALLVPAVAMGVMFGLFLLIALAIDLFGGFKATFILRTAGVRSLSC